MSLQRDPSRTLHGYYRAVQSCLCFLKHRRSNEIQEYLHCSLASYRCKCFGRNDLVAMSSLHPTLAPSVSKHLQIDRSSLVGCQKVRQSQLHPVRYRDHGRCLHRRLIYPCCQAQVQGYSKHVCCCYQWYAEYHPYTKLHSLDGFQIAFSLFGKPALQAHQ